MASAVMHVTTSDTTATNPTPVITTTTVPTALKGLKTTPATKTKSSLPSTSMSSTCKTNHKTSGSVKNTRSQKTKTLLNCCHPFKNLMNLTLNQKLKVSLNQWNLLLWLSQIKKVSHD